MAFALPLPKGRKKEGWKVKIHDKESREAPHITIWFKRNKWRVNLRDGTFMDDGGWNDIHEEVAEVVRNNWTRLQNEWDKMYGDVNPISSEGEDE